MTVTTAGHETAALTFARTSERDAGERQVIVRIDGGAPITLYYGDTVTVTIAPGAHRVRVHNTLVWRTLHVTAAAGEARTFDIVNYAPAFAMGLLATVGAGPLFLKVDERNV